MSPHVADDRLSAYVDGELLPQERGAVEGHLEGCAECRGTVEDYRALNGLARALPMPESAADPQEVAAQVRSAIVRSRRTPSPWWWAAAAVLVLAVIPWQLARQSELEPSRSVAFAPPPADVAPAAPAAGAGAPAAKQEELQAQPKRLARQQERVDTKAKGDAAPPEPMVVARDASDELEERKSRDKAVGFAEPPPPAPAAPASAAAEADRRGYLDDEAAGRRRLEGSQTTMAGGAPPPASLTLKKAQAEDEDANYRRLEAGIVRSGDEARRQRDQWTAFANRFPAGERGERARVAAIDAAADAYRYDHLAADLTVLRALAREYLERRNAPAADHVRARLDEALRAAAP